MEKLLQILYENKILFHCFSKFEIFCAHLWHVTIMSHQNKVFLFFFFFFKCHLSNLGHKATQTHHQTGCLAESAL